MAHIEHASSASTSAPEKVSYDLLTVAEAMRSMSELVDDERGHPLERLVAVAVHQVPGARWASVSQLRGERFTTVASTGEEAARADALQYEIGSGPCVDAVLEDSVYVTGDVSAETRWAEWGRRAHAEAGVTSVLSQRLHHHDSDAGVLAGLNIYSEAPDAFDPAAVGMGLILATHGALVFSEMLATHRAVNLGKALQSNREIGVAMGILMHQHRLSRQEAFDVLRVASQNSNRKLSDVASEVADTGTLVISRPR
ncbi:MAG: ANTAR domain-containing protein [Ornithinibacter sp.]